MISKVSQWALVGAAFIFTVLVYRDLPDTVPTHWGFSGADGFSPKPWGPFFMPGMMAVVAAVHPITARLAPKALGSESNRGPAEHLLTAVLVFLGFMHVASLLTARGTGLNTTQFVYVGAGALYVVIGNVLPKLRRNRFAGIRTRWTLASDEVWHRTHRVGGLLFVLGGVITMLGALFGAGAMALMAATIGSVVVTVVYSYDLHRSGRAV
jgi:uncharacterized membrane protein